MRSWDAPFCVIPTIVTSIELEDKTLQIKNKICPGYLLMILLYPPDSNRRINTCSDSGMLSGTLILASGAMVMSLPKLVGNSILLWNVTMAYVLLILYIKDKVRLVRTYDQDHN